MNYEFVKLKTNSLFENLLLTGVIRWLTQDSLFVIIRNSLK